MTEPTAYERLQQAAAEASSKARLLALVILRDVCQEYAALDAEWRSRQDPAAEEVRAVLARIRTALGPAAEVPPADESLEERAARLVRHLFADQTTEPEHCTHSRAMHDRHHQQHVDGCPWCAQPGTTLIDPGDLL